MLRQVLSSCVEDLLIPFDGIWVLKCHAPPLEEGQGTNEFAPGNVAHEELVAQLHRDSSQQADHVAVVLLLGLRLDGLKLQFVQGLVPLDLHVVQLHTVCSDTVAHAGLNLVHCLGEFPSQRQVVEQSRCLLESWEQLVLLEAIFRYHVSCIGEADQSTTNK